MSNPFPRWAFPAAVAVIAIGLTAVFMLPLWLNKGLVGGDIITYFLPQKTFLATSLAAGDVPFWNPTVALGYPFVADSQIALFYPTTIPLHLAVRPETALHINLILHYALAFVGTVLLARRLDVGRVGSLLTALAFVYGWFPPRLTVEWAITTGAYLPWALWACESFLRSGGTRWLATLAGLLTLQLLAGHFSLAFITHLTLAVWTLGRLTFAKREDDAPLRRWPSVAVVAAVLLTAFPLAAVQLAPTWELRQTSERGGLPIPDVDYGRVPWQHLAQLVWPPAAWSGDVNRYGGADTNPPAASLYVGVVCVLLAVVGVVKSGDRRDRMWWLLVPLAVVFAVGWATPIYQHLPGFGYFKIPGRYGIVAALGLSVLGGRGLSWLFGRLGEGADGMDPKAAVAAAACLIALTVELRVHAASGVFFTEFVPIHSADLIDESVLLDSLRSPSGPPRIWCEGQNTAASLGLHVSPGFVGLPPDAYVDPETRPPEGADPTGPRPGQIERARRYGVTHIFFDSEPDFAAWECRPFAAVTDHFLSLAMNRVDLQARKMRPFFIGELTDTRGRAAMTDGRLATVTSYTPDRVAVEAEGPGTLVLTDLDYPGWSVTVDGSPAETTVVDGVLRGVELPAGQHTAVWSYEPVSVKVGAAVSLLTALLLASGGWFVRRYDRPWMTPEPKTSATNTAG